MRVRWVMAGALAAMMSSGCAEEGEPGQGPDDGGADASAVEPDARPGDGAIGDPSDADDPDGPETCGADEFVSGNACTPCAPGTTNGAGDDPAGGETACEAIICGADQFVRDHACVECPAGASNPAGDDASGDDTACADPCSMVLGVDCAAFEQAFVKAGDSAAGDAFGVSVALSGDTLAVGADRHTDDRGAVYVFTRADGVWSEQARLVAPAADDRDSFGRSVALDGDTLVVGALGEDSGAEGIDGDAEDNGLENAGAAYVFARDGDDWALQAYLKAAAPDAQDFFGESVTIDGDTIAVTARGEDSSATEVDGDARDNGAWDSGAVYVFVRDGDGWSQQAYVKASNAARDDFFGSSVALDGDTLAVGARAEDGGDAGVDGDQEDDAVRNSGAAYVFTRAGGVWSQQAYLKASNPGEDDEFGWSVALDGDTLAVGARGEDSGAAADAVDPEDDSAPSAGAVYIFARTGETWSAQGWLKASNAGGADPNTGGGDEFGWSLALDGDTLAVGARSERSSSRGLDGDQDDDSIQRAGAVYLFVRAEETWGQRAYIKASNTDVGDAFGVSVALDDGTLAVGANGEDSASADDPSDNDNNDSGAVYVRLVAP